MERVGFFFLVKWFDRVMSVVQASAIHVFLNRKITREKQKTKPKKIKKKINSPDKIKSTLLIKMNHRENCRGAKTLRREKAKDNSRNGLTE